ncbi:MAG: hypothetical protein O2807_11025 [bacterium]|nr:hypothetical protein [bacterium]
MYENPLLLVGAIFAAGALLVLLPIVLMVYQRFGPRVALRCPETGILTSLQVGAGRAMWSSMFGAAKLRIKDCARWPERADCDQACLQESNLPPEPVVVRQASEGIFR